MSSSSHSPVLLLLLHTLRQSPSHSIPLTSLSQFLTRHSTTPIDATRWLDEKDVKKAITVEKNEIKATKDGNQLWSAPTILPHLAPTLHLLTQWQPIGHSHTITKSRHTHLIHVLQHHYDIYVRDGHTLDDEGMNHVMEAITHAYAFLHLHQPIATASSWDDKLILEDIVLRELYEYGEIQDSWKLLEIYGRDKNEHERLVGVLTSLASNEFRYITVTIRDTSILALTPEGREYELKGTPEAQVWNSIGKNGGAVNEIQAKLGKLYQIGFNTLMKNKLLEMDKSDPKNPFVKQKGTFTDHVQQQLHKIAKGEPVEEKELVELKKRQLIVQQSHRTYSIARGPNFQRFRKPQLIDLTHDLLQSGDWKNETFKERNWDALAPRLNAGILHPLMKVRAQFRSILLEMGFSEMPTNNFVESSFWNFDALYQPQQHPARDSHDTFFVSHPAKTRYIPEKYCQAVKDIHEKGGFDSIGYRYDWKLEEAQKNILRTHTTAVSSRMLKLLADQPVFTPKKYFSIDRVFRNETLDSTHLAEFHQVEGLVADYDLTLGDLMGVIKTFFSRIGIEDIRFKPAYNPYTEPSMEIFGKSKEGRVMEIGNSGVFRPEMLRPMGLPEGVRVIAWGLSLERPTMIKYGVRNIRDLFGHKVKLNIIERNPIARFDD